MGEFLEINEWLDIFRNLQLVRIYTPMMTQIWIHSGAANWHPANGSVSNLRREFDTWLENWSFSHRWNNNKTTVCGETGNHHPYSCNDRSKSQHKTDKYPNPGTSGFEKTSIKVVTAQLDDTETKSLNFANNSVNVRFTQYTCAWVTEFTMNKLIVPSIPRMMCVAFIWSGFIVNASMRNHQPVKNCNSSERSH